MALASLPLASQDPQAGAGHAPARRWLVAAVAFFIVVKLVWVLVPAAVMGVPRLGDDALVYLWNGFNTVAAPQTDTPALRDIVRLRQEAGATPELDRARSRVTMRTTRVSSSPVALGTGALLAAGLGHRTVFAILESAIAVVLALAIGCCIRHLQGSGAAAGTLAVLALALLPNQGLHYLVPGVLVLALAFFLWTSVLRRGSPWTCLWLPVLMLLAHPIGPVYLLVAAALLAGRALLAMHWRRDDTFRLLALVAAVPIWLGINHLTGAREPMTSGLGGLSLAGIPANVAGLAGHVKTLATGEPFLFLLLLTGAVLAVRRRREEPDSFLLSGVLAGVVATTVIVDVPGYPGELPSRALIALVIVCSGIAIGGLLRAAARLPRRRASLAAALAVAAVWCTQAPAFARLAFDNLNSRHQLYDNGLLHAEIAALPKDAVVIWADTDLGMMAAFLEGADRLRAIPYAMLARPSALRANVEGASEVLVATTVPERLNGLSTIQARSLQRRYYGYGFDWFRRVSLYADPGRPLPAFVRLEGEGALRVSGGAGEACTVAAEPAAGPGWYRLGGCGSQGTLHMVSDSPRLRVTGLSMQVPDAARPWPWGQDFKLRAEPRGKEEAAELRFTFAYLLGKDMAAALESELGPLALVASRSGLIWLKAAASS